MMARRLPLFAALAASALVTVGWVRPARDAAPAKGERVVLAVHGGAGVLPRKKMTPELEKAYRADLEAALKAGHEALKKGTSLDAVTAAVVVLEDSPRYNAGKGAVFTNDGRNELD